MAEAVAAKTLRPPSHRVAQRGAHGSVQQELQAAVCRAARDLSRQGSRRAEARRTQEHTRRSRDAARTRRGSYKQCVPGPQDAKQKECSVVQSG